MDDIQQAQLWQVLQSPPPDGGLWNGQKVADWISELLGYSVSRQRGWEYLKGMKLRLRVPRPSHEETDYFEQEEWKKKLASQVERVQKSHPDADVEVWTMDEHKVGLKPIIRRMWVDEWTVPVANVNWRYKWLWLYGFVHPQSGETYWWILPFVNTEIFNQVLADFAEHFNIGKNKQVVLALDQAGWHTAGKLETPIGIHIVEMPSHSPELQPAERLWSLTNEPLANRTFENRTGIRRGFISSLRTITSTTRFNSGFNKLSLVASSSSYCLITGKYPDIILLGNHPSSSIPHNTYFIPLVNA